MDDARLKNLGGGGYWKQLPDPHPATSAQRRRCFTARLLDLYRHQRD